MNNPLPYPRRERRPLRKINVHTYLDILSITWCDIIYEIVHYIFMYGLIGEMTLRLSMANIKKITDCIMLTLRFTDIYIRP